MFWERQSQWRYILTPLAEKELENMKKKIKRIKDLPANASLYGVKFKHPETGKVCIWASQWDYSPNGEAGIFYKKVGNKNQLFTIQLKNLQEALEFKLA